MKKYLAALLAASMILSNAAVSFAAVTPIEAWGETDATGKNDVVDPIISYQIPTTLEFSLDAFAMSDNTGSQVYSPAIEIINKSQVAIKVDVKADLTLEEGVTAKTAVGEVKVDDPSYTEKDLYMELVAQKITSATMTGTPDFEVTVTPEKIKYNQTAVPEELLGANTAAKAVLASASADKEYEKPTLMTLALAAAPYTTGETPALDNSKYAKESVGALRFAGTINPNTTWADKNTTADVTVNAVFDVRGMTSSVYDAAFPVELDEDLAKANVMSVGAGGGAVATGEPAIKKDSISVTGSGATFDVDWGADDKAATSITSITYGASNTALVIGGRGANCTISGATVTITTTAVHGQPVTVTFDNDATATATIPNP